MIRIIITVRPSQCKKAYKLEIKNLGRFTILISHHTEDWRDTIMLFEGYKEISIYKTYSLILNRI